MLEIIGLIFIGLVILVLLIDIIPIIKDWVGRIRIGRYNDKEMWNQSITNIGVEWLNKTPKIKVTDNTRLVAIDMLKGNYTKNAIQYWQEAALLLGLGEQLNCKRKDEKIEKEIKKFLRRKFDQNGQWIQKPEHIDAAILAYSILKLNFINPDLYRPALDYIWELIKDNLGEDGTVGYRKSMQNYRYVDTIGFICPFLVSYGIKYGNNDCIDLAVKQIQEYEQYGMLEKHNLPAHAYNIETKVPLGLYGWGRGLGWYAIGLIDAWNELPQNNKYKNLLEQSVKEFATASLKFQQDNGAWNWTVTRNETRPDSSTTATLGYFMLNAAKIDGIFKECLASSDKAIAYLMKVTRRNGVVDFSQGDTKDIGVYSMLFNVLPFTQGFCIRMTNLHYIFKVVNDYDKEVS
ncbi:glycoside hydrolase family 88 protein [Niallia oryzisoli]|uniref:Glycoside hydrolase family 88 protein n=1 Tax=Niallia oryzisoli TaxID=1737571 RepID=A0ABZ2CF33_9BACI